MHKYAMILYDQVHNIIESQERPVFPPDPDGNTIEIVDIPDGVTVYEGWDYNRETGVFSGEVPPDPVPPSQDELNAQAREMAKESETFEYEGQQLTVNSGAKQLEFVEESDIALGESKADVLRTLVYTKAREIDLRYPVADTPVAPEIESAVIKTVKNDELLMNLEYLTALQEMSFM